MSIHIKPQNRGKLINRKYNLPYFSEINGTLNKICSTCGKYYPATSEYFHKTKINNIGLKSSCKYCTCKHFKDKDYYKRKNFNIEGLLLCKVCLKYKNTDEFRNNNKMPTRNFKSRECKSCESERKKLSRIKNLPKEDLDIHLKNCLNGCYTRSRGLTKKSSSFNKPIDISLNYLKLLYKEQNGICAISGIKMTYLIGNGRHNYNISVDRINPDKGYLKNNIQLVCSHINMMKGKLDYEELISFCEKILNYYEYKYKKIA